MVLPIFGGVLLDTIGVRTGLVLFCCVAVLGQAVFCAGGYSSDFNTMIIGRTIFGMGGESLAVA